jgi:type I restriction enzyme S subunit
MSDSLRSLSNIEYGASPKEIRAEDYTPTGIYGTGGLVGYSKKVLFSGPLVVVARKGTLDNPIYVHGDCWIIDTAYAVLPKENVDAKWLYYNLSNYDLKKLNESTGVPSISRDYLYRLSFVKFPLHEQRKIAGILSTVDAVIEKTEAAIAKYKAIKSGMMRDLFTRGIDLATGKLRPPREEAPELYKPSNLGWVPKEWEVKPLVVLTTQIGDGIHTTPKYSTNTDYFFINGNNLVNGRIDISTACPCVSEEEYKKHFKELNNRTILYSINGTIGNIALYNLEKVILGKSAAYISCNNELDFDYLYLYLQTELVVKYYKNEMTGSTINNLSLASIRNTPVAYPIISDEQNQIAKRIKSIINKIQMEALYLSKYQQLKQALMSDLLTGKVRVKYDENETEVV